jgi:hypothetical protein
MGTVFTRPKPRAALLTSFVAYNLRRVGRRIAIDLEAI